MRTEISSLGEFGLIRRLTDGIELKNESSRYGVGVMLPYSPILLKNKS